LQKPELRTTVRKERREIRAGPMMAKNRS
jgi:hypothetical protein